MAHKSSKEESAYTLAGLTIDLYQKLRNDKLFLSQISWFNNLSDNERKNIAEGKYKLVNSNDRLLKAIHQNRDVIVHQVFNQKRHIPVEEILGLACGHTKGEDTIPILIEKLREKKVFFSSEDEGVNHIKKIKKAEKLQDSLYIYLFTHLNEEGGISGKYIRFNSTGIPIQVKDLFFHYTWDIVLFSNICIVVPITKE